ncbi:MAG: amidohydrolase family protein [Acidobacteria bacterium]|nr:amidohydrolase family protein [Acidobacteriota bacterium]
MEPKKCSGVNALSGAPAEVVFTTAIESVNPLLTTSSSRYLSPGWVDIQVNGFAGADYCSPGTPVDKIAHSIEVLWSTGVTRLFPTVITGSPAFMAGAIANLAKAKAELPLHGKSMVGFHIEGPYISAEDGPRGAHPLPAVRPPDTDEFRRWMDISEGQIKLITIAPEWPGACAYIEHAVRHGVVMSIGHTNANAAQIDDAVRAGATMSTHLGNGAHKFILRHPNYMWDQLADDRLAASFIADGIHLPASFLKVALRAKGIEHSVLTTDAVMPAGCKPGMYRLGEVDVELHEPGDRVTLVGQERLAGSALRMDTGVGNLMKLAGLRLNEAITMASINPARCGRIPANQKGLAPGAAADIVEFDFDAGRADITIRAVWLDGERVWTAA